MFWGDGEGCKNIPIWGLRGAKVLAGGIRARLAKVVAVLAAIM
jgi:hypothetical protein